MIIKLKKGNSMFGFLGKKNTRIDIASLIKLAKENDKDAQCQLGLAYYRGTGVAKDVEKASYWLGKAQNDN